MGSLTVREDRWSVLLDTATGRMSVEHWWAYLNPDTEEPVAEDGQIYSLEEFALTDLGQELQSRLSPAISTVQKT
jgi:hypothetical protein